MFDQYHFDNFFFQAFHFDIFFRLWDVSNGIMLNRVDTKSAVRTCKFSYSGDKIAFTTDKQMGQPCVIHVVDVNNFGSGSENSMITIPIPAKGPKVTSLVWGDLDKQLITGHENGDIVQWDLGERQKVNMVSDHGKSISDMQLSPDRTMFISASKDTTAKLFDCDSLECLKTYKTDRPVNSAAISPIYEHVVLGGGQEAMEVTTTSTKIGKFDARFFHMVYENEEFARLKGHFGPINSLAFNPDGLSYASGGEDGYVRINTFDKSYHDFRFEAFAA